MPDLQGRLDAIVKAYDIRGTYPEQLDEHVAGRLGLGFASFLREADPSAERVLVGIWLAGSGMVTIWLLAGVAVLAWMTSRAPRMDACIRRRTRGCRRKASTSITRSGANSPSTSIRSSRRVFGDE